MLFGINVDIIGRAIPGMTAVRRVIPFAGQLSRDYLAGGQAAGLTWFVSVSPELEPVADGKMDAELAAWLKDLPPGSYAAIGSGENAPHKQVDPVLWKKATARMQAVKNTVNAPVQVGYVLDVHYPARRGQDLAEWVIGHADWAGLAGFQDQESDTPQDLFGDAFALVREAPGMPELVIAETGTALDADAWAGAVLGYAVRGQETDRAVFNRAPLDALLWHAKPHSSKYQGIPGDATLERMCREAAWAR